MAHSRGTARPFGRVLTALAPTDHAGIFYFVKRILTKRGPWRVLALLSVVLWQFGVLSSGQPIGLPSVSVAQAAGVCPTDSSALSTAIGTAGPGGTVALNCATPTTIAFSAGITIAQTVTLDASGSSNAVTLNGGSARLFSVTGGTFTLNNLTVTGGLTPSAGGAISNAATLNINNTTFSGNKAAGGGGAIANLTGGTLNISNSTVTGNSASGGDGGAINNAGTLTVTNSTMTGNSAPAGNGGAIASTGLMTVTNSTFSSNSAWAHSGAIDGNNVPNLAASRFTGDTFNNNTAANGGALTFGSNNPAIILNSTFAANSSSGPGGAIYTYAPVDLSFSTLYNNTVTGGGAAIGLNFVGPAAITVAGTILDNPVNCSNPATDKGSNLTFLGGNCNLLGSTDLSTDPQLGALANNGGSTQTMAVPSIGAAIGAAACGDTSGNRVATDQRGNNRPVSACTIGAYEVDQANDTWVNALTLNQTSGSYQVNQTQNQNVFAPNQARWYKFLVTPGGQVHISYQGDPGAIVSLHSDMQTAYNSITTPANVAVASAQNSSSGFLPQSYLPQSYLPQSYLPQSYLPQSYLPQSYLPQSYLPQSYLPQSYLPQSYLPQSYLPQSYLPGPYSGAVDASLLTLSGIPNSSTQTIDHYTWNGSGFFYVRVVGPPNHNKQFQITVTETTGVCGGSSPVSAIPATTPTNIPAGLKSLILWDSTRIAGAPSDISNLTSKLAAFAGRAADVGGAVVDLSGNSGIQAAEAQSDSHPGCPTAKNIVANDIKSVVQAYRAQNTGLKYIVIVGDDHSIPFFRYPDRAGLGPENQFYPPAADNSASNASLRNNYLLGQDGYGASVDLPISDLSLPIPDLAVGRLVSTASEVSHMLDVYTNANGTLTPSSSLVTGYDFVSDAACNAQADLVAGMPTGGTSDSLITNGTKTVSSTCTASSTDWTASNVSQKLLGSRHDIVFMAGHYSAGALEAADYSTSLSAAAVASSTLDMTNTLVLALGCHGGYNIPRLDGVPNFSPSPDWTQAFAQKGATLLASTGYAYGDTDLNEYGGHLFDNYVKQLRSYSDSVAGYVPVAVGQANILAKKEYLATHTNLSGVDEKTLLETTLYGLPMTKVNMTGTHVFTGSDTSIVSSAPTVSPGPGQQFGTGSADIDLSPRLTTNTQSLNNGSVTATYLSGPDGVVARPGEPILPAQVSNVHVSNQILRGVGFRAGTYSDMPNITPLTSAAGTETSVGHPAFYSSVFYPTQVGTPNFFDAIGGGAEHLAVTPAQYISSGATSPSGTLRQFTNLKFRLFYLPSNWIGTPPTAQAAEAGASTISSVSALPDPSTSGNVKFNVHVLSDPTAGTQGVWVTYTSPGSNTWQSIDLSQNGSDPTLWTASQPLPSGIAFMVQAVNGAGLVTLSNNYGAYHTVGSASAPALASTSISLQSPPTSGVFQANSTFNVSLLSTGPALPAGQLVTVSIGGQQGFATTDGSGNATVTVPLVQKPGAYNVTASYAGDSGHQASTQTLGQTFQVTPAPTNLTLSPSSASSDYSDPAPISATLTDASGQALAQKSIVFTVSDNARIYRHNSITDKNGNAHLGPVPLPAGTYSVNAAFGGQDHPLAVTIGSSTVTELDPDYATPAAPSAAVLTINPEGATSGDLTIAYNGDSVDPINSTLHFSATVSQPNDNFPNDLSQAMVRFTVTDANGTVTTPQPVALTLSSNSTGVATLTLPAPAAPDVYNVTATVVGGYFSGSTSALLAIYDPSAGFVTGGGWINSPAGAYAPNPSLTGRANFGFVAKYHKGASVPDGQTQFEFKEGSLNFHSTSYDWLVVSGSCKAQFKGSGTLAGSMDQYGFILTAIDGEGCSNPGPDRFRIKIWDNTTGGNIVYDNQMNAPDTGDLATAIGGGNIQIHN